MIEVHLLRYALAAADSGSFSRAAEQFRVKQTTLSKRIRFLELCLGMPLFTRSTQGVSPTPSGTKFLARARMIVSDLDLLSMDALDLARGDQGKLRIGFHGTLAAGDLRTTLGDYRREAPDVEIDIIEAGRDRLLEDVDRDRLDLAVVAGETHDGRRRSLCLWSEPLTLGFQIGHPLLDREPLYWTDLRAMTFLVTRDDPGALIAAMIVSRLAGPGHGPRIVTHAVSRDNLHSLAEWDRISVTAGIATRPADGLEFRDVHDAFGPSRLGQSLHWRLENDNPALTRFLAIAAARYGRSPEIGKAATLGRA